MAEGGIDNFFSDIQKELECGVCLEQITDAKLLKCLHTFCEECLVKLDKRGTISCPICRTTTHLSKQGVQDLSSYCFFNRITELVQAQGGSSASGGSICGNCNAGRTVKFYCFDCKHFLCEPCIDAHDKMKIFTQGHQVVELGKFSSEDCKNFVGRPDKCKKHSKEELRFYCDDCDECICRDCTVVEHRNHNCLHLEDAVERQKEALEIKMRQIEESASFMESCCTLLDERAIAQTQEAQKAKNNLKATCELLVKTIYEHLDETTKDIEKQTHDHLQAISSQKEAILAEQSNLKNCLKFNKDVLNRGCSSEIMELKDVLNDRLEELGIKNQNQPSIKSLHIKYVSNNNTLEAMQQIGEVQTCFTDPSLTKTEGDGIKVATVGEENHFIVVTMGSDGKPTDSSEDHVTVEIESLSGDSRIPVKVSCQQDGKYKVIYTPVCCGNYKIHVLVNGESIAGSPSELTVKNNAIVPIPKARWTTSGLSKLVESVLLKQHKIKDVNITVESPIKVFARVTANVDSEALGLNDEEIGQLLEKIRKETNIEFHFASFAYLISGTFEQIAASREHLQKEQLKRPRQKIPIKKKDGHQQSTASFGRHWKTKPRDPQEEDATSGYAVNNFQKSADEDEDEGYLTTANFMKMFRKAYKKQLEKMTENYNVEILQYSDPKGEMKVKVKSKNRRTDFQPLRRAREEFITLYQTAQQNSKLVRFSTLDKNEANCSKLRQVIRNLDKELPVVIDRADDRVSYQIYGERDTVEQALQELHDKVGIETDDFQLSGARSSTVQSSSIFDAEEAMDLDDDDLHKYEHYSGAVKISVLKGDITDQRVDAIVNAANGYLSHGAGVAGAIVRKGGYSIQDESDRIVRQYGPVKAGDVVDTEPGNLPCRKIIHAVGPMWITEGKERSRKLLRAACINSLLKAEELKLTSIAFPAISSGIFGMPKEMSAEVMFAAIEEYASAKRSSKPVVTDVRFVIIDDPTVTVFREEFEYLYGGIDDNTPEQDETKDTNSKREPAMNKTRRHSRELYNPPLTKTGQINTGEKSDRDAALVEWAAVVVDDKGGKRRPLRGKKLKTKPTLRKRCLISL